MLYTVYKQPVVKLYHESNQREGSSPRQLLQWLIVGVETRKGATRASRTAGDETFVDKAMQWGLRFDAWLSAEQHHTHIYNIYYTYNDKTFAFSPFIIRRAARLPTHNHTRIHMCDNGVICSPRGDITYIGARHSTAHTSTNGIDGNAQDERGETSKGRYTLASSSPTSIKPQPPSLSRVQMNQPTSYTIMWIYV